MTTTTAESAAESLIANAPYTSAAALGGNRDDLVWLLAAAYREGRFDAQGEALERHLRELREQLRTRDATPPAVEFPIAGPPKVYGEIHGTAAPVTLAGAPYLRRGRL